MLIKLNLELLQKSDYQKWDDFVNLHPNSTIFHTIQWKTVIEKSFHYQPLYLVLKNSENKIVGIAPSFLVKKLGISNKIISSLPFFEYGGCLFKKDMKRAMT